MPASLETYHPFDDIVRDDSYRYWYASEQFWSISQILRLTGIKKSHFAMDASTLEWAAERGKAIEAITTNFLRDGWASHSIPAWSKRKNGETITLADDVRERIPAIQSFMATKPVYVTHDQYVADFEAGIAGELDWILRIDGEMLVVDGKATSQEEKLPWKIQLGFLLAGWEARAGERCGCAVLHFQSSLKKGWILRRYDRAECLAVWERVRDAWMESKSAFERARKELE